MFHQTILNTKIPMLLAIMVHRHSETVSNIKRQLLNSIVCQYPQRLDARVKFCAGNGRQLNNAVYAMRGHALHGWLAE
jgi:hypothetical protein